MKKIWFRVGMEAELTEEEYAELMETRDKWDYEKLLTIFQKIIDKGELSGETYILGKNQACVDGYDNPENEISVLF